MIRAPLSRFWQNVKAYATHPDPMVASCNLIALVVASNQPFYPLYVYWAVSDVIWPTLFTFLSTPFFLAVPFVAKRAPLAGRALLPLAGIANAVLSTKMFGQPSGVQIFLIPCALIAATFFRPSERWLGFSIVALALFAYLANGAVYGSAAHSYTQIEYEAFARLNALSAGTLTVFVGLLNAGLIGEKRTPSSSTQPPRA
ncbi:MAG: hypothetical protein AB7I34_09135 [Rhizobiaceae bacterium]